MCKLRFAALHITEQCSHECPCCYYRGAKGAPDGNRAMHFPIESLFDIVNQLHVCGTEEIFLLGGDPAQYPYILELAKYSNDRGMVITSISNTHEYCCSREELSKYISIFESTIHSNVESDHDAFCRSSGAYDKVLKNLLEFKKTGCKIGVTVNLMPNNVDYLYDIVRQIVLVRGVDLDYINIQRIALSGRAQGCGEYHFSRINLPTIFESIEKIEIDFGLEIQCEDAFPLCCVPRKFWKYINKCGWGFDKLSINGDGGVARCGADSRYNLGNVFETPLDTIWKHSEKLTQFRKKEFLPVRCKSCPEMLRCGGGCVFGRNGQDFNDDILLS